MKFAQLIAVASAVRISQKKGGPADVESGPQGPPSAADIVAHCDSSKDGMLDQKEVVDCMMKHAPPGATRADAEAMVAADWAMVDSS
jgi:hypothetical protein